MLFVSTLAFSSVLAGPPPIDRLGASRPPYQPIVGGRPTEGTEFAAVVAIDSAEGTCTGTVVSENLILTAAHCLTSLSANAEVSITYGSDSDKGDVTRALQWQSHPKFCRTCDEEIFDIGFLTVDGSLAIPGGYIPPIVSQEEWNATMEAGAPVTLVGYGRDPRFTGLSQGAGVKRAVETTISRFTDHGFEFFAGGEDRDSCEGDSGGPAIVRVGIGEFRLAGITSRGPNPCGSGGYYGVPYPSLCWLRAETGYDAIGDGCGTCDCLDTDPKRTPPQGCALTGDGRPSWGTLVLLMAFFFRRRSSPRPVAAPS